MSRPVGRGLLWGVRATFTLGAGASLAANVLHADPNPVSQVIAGWPPLALVLAVELISRIPVHRRALAAVRVAATATLAGIAAWVSYWHMVEVIRVHGETGSAPYVLPLTVDGLMVVASVCLVEIGQAARKTSPEMAPAGVGSHHSAAALSPTEQPAGTVPEPTPEVIPDAVTARNPRGYVKATAREVILNRPNATVPELVAELVDRTGTHHKHAAQTVRSALQEGIAA